MFYCEASGKMNYSWNEIILSEDYSKINYDIVYGSMFHHLDLD